MFMFLYVCPILGQTLYRTFSAKESKYFCSFNILWQCFFNGCLCLFMRSPKGASVANQSHSLKVNGIHYIHPIPMVIEESDTCMTTATHTCMSDNS